jgi:hypothetical protein
MDRRQTSQLLTGVVLVTVGLLFLGDQLDWFPHYHFDRLWPVILVVLGIGMLLSPRCGGRESNGGVWVLLVGVLFLLQNFHVMSFAQSWPLFVVAAGLLILFGRRRPPTSSGPQP